LVSVLADLELLTVADNRLRLCRIGASINMRPPLQTLEVTMLFSLFAQSAAALALLTIGLAAPAHAQFNKQIISGTQVYYKFGPGRFPSIQIDTVTTGGSTSVTAQCVVVGNLTDN
jgi:hypothetical protein